MTVSTEPIQTEPIQTEPAPLPFAEFVALVALMIAMVAMSIDAMLPALATIGTELGMARENDRQLIIALLFLGMGVGQIFYGPFSDSVGRKPAIYLGIALFMVGCVVAIFAQSMMVLLAGRLIQGIGVAGPRSVAVALVRDQFAGRAMARVMSFVMTVFILVPVIAPAIGQGILLVAHWRAIFGLYLILAVVILLWFGVRQPETLAPDNRIRFSLPSFISNLRAILANRIAFGYTLIAGLIGGVFVGFLNSAQQIFQEQYALGAQFPLYFAGLAIASGAASLLNAQLVTRFGMRKLCQVSLIALSALSLGILLLPSFNGGNPALWLTLLYLSVAFFGVGILFGNLNALAMEPLGHIAGVGAAVVGSLSTILSFFVGIAVGQAYDGTIAPLVLGFGLLGVLSMLIMWWAEKNSTDFTFLSAPIHERENDAKEQRQRG